MAIRRKVFICKFGRNSELDNKEKWQTKFSADNFRDNIVSHNLQTGEFAIVNDISQQLQQEQTTGTIQHEYFFLVVEQIGSINIRSTSQDFVSGYFAKSTRYLSSMVDFETGVVSDQNLRLKESGSTPSRFVYFLNDRHLYYEYNKNGVSFFDGRFYRYIDAIYGEDTIKIYPVMKNESMEQAIQRSHMKKLTLRVAATNVGFVNKLIGLPVSKQFAQSLGDENYQITVIVSSNRKSRLGENFVTGVWKAYNNFRRKEEIKKLEFLPEDDDPLILTKDLRYKFEKNFTTLSHRSKRIEEVDFRNKVISHYKDNIDAINGALE